MTPKNKLKFLGVSFLVIMALLFSIILYSTSEHGMKEIYKQNLRNSVENYKQSELIQGIYNNCQEYNESDYLTCISNKLDFQKIYHTSDNITDPDKILSEGGDCKTFTVYYNSLMDLKGIKYQTIQVKNHVFSITDNIGNFTYCVVDQELIQCYN